MSLAAALAESSKEPAGPSASDKLRADAEAEAEAELEAALKAGGAKRVRAALKALKAFDDDE